MKTIFITEKPSVAREYAKVLGMSGVKPGDGFVEGYSGRIGKDVIITWSVGHLIQICDPKEQNPDWEAWTMNVLPMIPKTWKYKPIASVSKQFSVVKSLYTRDDIGEIYYAGDSGREGIYIQALIRNQIFRKAPGFPEKVVWIDSFTEESILNGIRDAKPLTAYSDMIDAGYLRANFDWLVGMNFTRGLTLASGARKPIHTGRVMTPTLAMVVNRQKEIDAFTVQPYFGIAAGDGIYWKAQKPSRFTDSELLYNESGFLNRKDAESLLSELQPDKTLTVTRVTVTQKTEYAPHLYNLADLQADCSKRYHLTPANTLAIAQSLYEKHITTYPRTDSRYLSTAVAKEYAKKFDYRVPDRYVNDDKVTDHYAIIPTFEKTGEQLTEIEANVYVMILNRFLNTMKPPFKYNAVTVMYQHRNKEPFFESWRQVVDRGFKEGEPQESEEDGKKEDGSEEKNKPIPKEGMTITVPAYTIREMTTKPPKPYTTGSLILAMEKAGKLVEDEDLRAAIKGCGIGTSATRAGIIEKLSTLGYISIAKSQVVSPTDLGYRVISVTEEIDPVLTSPVKTAEMEELLNDVATGKVKKDAADRQIQSYVMKTNNDIAVNNSVKGAYHEKTDEPKQIYPCPSCNKPLSYGRFGWYCPKTDGCGFSFSHDQSPKGGKCHHKMTEKDLKDLIEKGKTGYYDFTWASGKTSKAARAFDKDKKQLCFVFQERSDKKL